MIVRFFSALVFAFLAVGPSAAAIYNFGIQNNTSETIRRVHVFGGEAIGFEPIRRGDTFAFKVELPEGECWATIRISFKNRAYLDVGNFDFCSGKFDSVRVWD